MLTFIEIAHKEIKNVCLHICSAMHQNNCEWYEINITENISSFFLLGPLICIAHPPTRLKAKLSEALARVENLEREKQNAKETESKENCKETSGRSEGKEPCVCV